VLLAGAEPLPQASTSEIAGLLEYLDARGGREDVFKIAADTGRKFDHLITVIQAAELLDFVDTPRRMVVLADEGHRFVKADAEGRKAVWRARILTLGLFQEVQRMLERQPDRSLDARIVREMIALGMPQEDEAGIFQTLVRWARYGGLFSYDEGKRRLGVG
jgi:NitT/TauT family transport system ATP-binding protein